MSDTAFPYQIDDTVYVASASSYLRTEVECPVCFGNLSVVLILGNGEHQPIECDFCRDGYKGPCGVVQGYKAHSSVRPIVITGFGKDGRGWYVTSGHQAEHLNDGNVFSTQAEAEGRRVDLYAAAAIEAEQAWERNICSQKSKPTWSVGYHRAELTELRRKVAYHENKLSEKKKAKEQP